MEKSITAVVYESHGNPSEVLQVVKRQCPAPAPNEVLVEMHAAPVNPADINTIEGKYPGHRELPGTPGMEGAGTVAELGSAVKHLHKGDHVILPHNLGTWREALTVDAEKVVVVPGEIDLTQAATLKINPLTAWRLLHGYVELKPGDWVIQNAANSAAGRAVIQIARERGFKTVNLVRREDVMEELKQEGADVVLLDDDSVRDGVKKATNNARIRLGFNAVGGDSALRVMNALAAEATLVTYGAMSLQPVKIPTGLLIFKDLRFRGIWINKWYDNATPEERIETFQPLFEMARRGLLKTKVEKTYPLQQVKEAVAHAMQGKRSGKIILKLNSGD